MMDNRREIIVVGGTEHFCHAVLANGQRLLSTDPLIFRRFVVPLTSSKSNYLVYSVTKGSNRYKNEWAAG